MSQTIIVTVSSRTPPDVTAERIRKMLRRRFEEVLAIADEQKSDQSVDDLLMESLDVVEESIKVFADGISTEFPQIRDIFGEYIVGIVKATAALRAFTRQKDKLLQAFVALEQRPDGGKGPPHTRTVMMHGNDVKMLHDMTKEEMRTVPGDLLHELFHRVADSKHVDADCLVDKETIINWLYDNVRPAKKDVN